MYKLYTFLPSDLGIDPEIRPYLKDMVGHVRQCKSGLIQVGTLNGKYFSVPRRYLVNVDTSRADINATAWSKWAQHLANLTNAVTIV